MLHSSPQRDYCQYIVYVYGNYKVYATNLGSFAYGCLCNCEIEFFLRTCVHCNHGTQIKFKCELMWALANRNPSKFTYPSNFLESLAYKLRMWNRVDGIEDVNVCVVFSFLKYPLQDLSVASMTSDHLLVIQCPHRRPEPRLTCIDNITATDNLATQTDRVSATMVLT